MGIISKPLYLFALATLLFSSCGKDEKAIEAELTINPKAFWDTERLEIGSTYSDPFDRPLLVQDFRCYLTGIYAINENDEALFISSVEHLDFSESPSIKKTLPTGRYKGLRFGIGVDAGRNTGQDPSQYPNAHPLSVVTSQGMFWTWNSGYIFVQFQGKTAFDGDANNMLDSYAFHIGTDNFYREIELLKAFEITENGGSIDLAFLADRFLESDELMLDLSISSVTHTMDNMVLANRFMELFEQAIVIR
jgi:hypothetical protein